MKNCLTAITAICDLMERQPALASDRVRKSLRVVSRRLRDLLAEQLAAETVWSGESRGDQERLAETPVDCNSSEVPC